MLSNKGQVKLLTTLTAKHVRTFYLWSYDDCSNNGELLVFEHDFHVNAWHCMHFLAVHDAVQGFTLENIVESSFSNIYKVALTACLLLSSIWLVHLLLLARSIQSISLLASAQGIEMQLYAFRQEVSRALFLASALGKNLDYAFVSWNTYQFRYLRSVLLVAGAAVGAAGAAGAESVPEGSISKHLRYRSTKPRYWYMNANI